MPVSGAESWTVVGDDGEVVAPAEQYLAHLSALERSPDTVRAYALSLRLWFDFLGQAGVGWAAATAEDVARFVAWLRAPAENVIVLEGGTGQRSAATVNRHLAAVFGLYDHHVRRGVSVAAGLVAWRRVSRGSYKPFLQHVTRGKPIATRPVKLAVTRRVPRTLDAFVNLFSGRVGQPLSYPTVHRLIGRIAARTGIAFTAHMLRHTHATELIRAGVPIEVVARLLTHRSSTTTSQTYIHLDVADVRAALTRAGVWDPAGSPR